MSTSVPKPDKDRESDIPDNWQYCRTFQIGPNSGNSPDGLNGSLHLSKADRESIGAEGGDVIVLRVAANDKIIYTERKIVSNGRQVTLPAEDRRKLDLEVGDTVTYWISPLNTTDEQDHSSTGTESIETSEPEDKGQQLLVQEEEVTQDAFVCIGGEDPWTYHRIGSEEDQQTVCGINYSNKEHRTMADPGSLNKCDLCSVDDPEQMNNKQKLAWLGRKGGFSPDRDSAYLTGPEMTSLIQYIQNKEKRLQKLEQEMDETDK